MCTTYNHRKGPGFAAAMRRGAERRRCPKCGRKSAIRRWRDEMGTYATCRWCDYVKATSWDDIYAKADAVRRERAAVEEDAPE